jgi:hypothetical protein
MGKIVVVPICRVNTLCILSLFPTVDLIFSHVNSVKRKQFNGKKRIRYTDKSYYGRYVNEQIHMNIYFVNKKIYSVFYTYSASLCRDCLRFS